MKLGAENKKSVYALTVLGVVAAYMVYSQFFSGPSYPTTPTPVARPEVPGDTTAQAGATPAPTEKNAGPDIAQSKSKVGKNSSKGKNGEFHPVYIAKNPKDRADVSKVDPTIRLDLLAKAMKAAQAGSERDLFQISKTPPIKEVAKLGPDVHIKPFLNYGPRAPLPPAPPPIERKAEIAPLVIPFKYYGISTVHPDGTRTGYFIIPGNTPDADEIFMANEGQVIKNHFRIVQISPDKAVVEDTQEKRQQPVNIEKDTQ
jgi:hypothetical protein